jgi:hypothetical protein
LVPIHRRFAPTPTADRHGRQASSPALLLRHRDEASEIVAVPQAVAVAPDAAA